MFLDSELVVDTLLDVMTNRWVTNGMIVMGIFVTLVTMVDIVRMSLAII